VYYTVSSNILTTFCFCQMYRIKHMFLSLNCIFEVKKIFFPFKHNVLRYRPFNLQGTTRKFRIFIFFVAQSANFFPEFNIRLYDKNSESDYYFFPSPKSEYFFSNIGNHNNFLEKKHSPPPPL
jgi:hypothetical protein